MSFYYRLISVNGPHYGRRVGGAFHSLWVVAFDSFTATWDRGFCLPSDSIPIPIRNSQSDAISMAIIAGIIFVCLKCSESN